MTAARTVVLDCRWLGIGGPGKATEFVLRGLAAAPPQERWVLWGREEAIAPLAWNGADLQPITEDPRVLLGQRRAYELPPGDFYVFMHQQRPLRAVPAATVVYDTIALRFGSRRTTRAVKKSFLRRVVATSRPILTISEHSKATIVRDLDVAEDRVEILRFPFDDTFVERVRRIRASATRTDAALFVGGFLPHKNLPRLLAAFAATGFRRQGGRLVLVAGTVRQATTFLRDLGAHQRSFVTVHHSCSQADLDRLYATSLFLVQPSLEEGFGLPAWEAMCCGLPVCVSDGGALPEVTRGFADPFPATSVEAMTAAIDRCAESARQHGDEDAIAQSALLRRRAPSVRDFGLQVRSSIEHEASALR
ncbi:MAG TPA: glycosyltransferase [Acidimicrobiales bacterium]|nr:glycosyltransferase [Acidimicrobiales bacterium]